MRGLMFAAALIAAVSVTGCDRRDSRNETPTVRASTVVEPETRVDSVPQEEPAVARSQWRAANEQARSVVGNLRVSLQGARGGPVVFAFANGVTVTAQPISVVAADSRSGSGGQSFAALMGGDPRVDAYLYRVLTENLSRSATQGGLCAADTTRHIAVSEFVDGSGRWVFKIAAFKSEAPPGVAGEDPLFCSAYAFASQ
ncbi:hypothetical protein U91I_01089 [alpha proteobacterium U9-1i]|nr:hypothetical protein U91I_01089 [alpha proteobacterium U9-1i]